MVGKIARPRKQRRSPPLGTASAAENSSWLDQFARREVRGVCPRTHSNRLTPGGPGACVLSIAVPRRKAWVSWSTGKDAAWALQVARQQDEIEIVGLLTTLNSEFERVAMHGVRAEVLRAQAAALNLPVHEVPLPWPCSNEDYERLLAAACEAALAQGVEAMVFGDLFLEDVRRYRESRLAGTGIVPVFPLFGRETRSLAQELVDAGVRAVLTTVDPRALDRRFAGRLFDEALLRELPLQVDPCFENGEAHTCVFAGPMFAAPLELRVGPAVERGGFVYADVALA